MRLDGVGTDVSGLVDTHGLRPAGAERRTHEATAESFRRSDPGGARTRLSDAVRREVERQGGVRPSRPVFPLARRRDFEASVSPFTPIDVEWRRWFGLPGERLAVDTANRDANTRLLEATLELRRREITIANLRPGPVGSRSCGEGSPMADGTIGARIGRATLEALFARLEGCEIEVVDDARRSRFGEPGAALSLEIEVHDPAFYRRAALGGEVSAIESYGDGQWDCSDLVALCQVVFRNQGAWRVGSPLARFTEAGRKLAHRLRANSRRNSRRNIAAHYDVGNDFYELFLDETLTYSAGIFESESSTLEEASIAKYERICRSIDLRPEDHVLEIGSGWGGFALHAAGRRGCRVTTTTISRNQYELASERIEKAGLKDRVTLLFEDYRDLTGEYDKLVSIEMIEAVGREYHDAYFRVCSERLAPHGAMALQAICVPDQRWDTYLASTDFIRDWVFPGGCLMSLGAVIESTRRTGDLRVTDVLDIGPDYAETLRRWRERLHAGWDAARSLGYGERFLRLWDFYLASCQAAFQERHIADLQVVLEKPRSGRALGAVGRH